jgi:hypothetical protein
LCGCFRRCYEKDVLKPIGVQGVMQTEYIGSLRPTPAQVETKKEGKTSIMGLGDSNPRRADKAWMQPAYRSRAASHRPLSQKIGLVGVSTVRIS